MMLETLWTILKLVGLVLFAALVVAVPVLVLVYIFYSMYGVATGIQFLPVIWFSMVDPMPLWGAVLVMFAFMLVLPRAIWSPAYIVCGIWATYTFWGWSLFGALAMYLTGFMIVLTVTFSGGLIAVLALAGISLKNLPKLFFKRTNRSNRTRK